MIEEYNTWFLAEGKNQTKKDTFKKWLAVLGADGIKKGHPPSTVRQYSNAIDKISQHYSENREPIDLYEVNDVEELSRISTLYRSGEYKKVGRTWSGDYRAAIQKLVNFEKYLNEHNLR